LKCTPDFKTGSKDAHRSTGATEKASRGAPPFVCAAAQLLQTLSVPQTPPSETGCMHRDSCTSESGFSHWALKLFESILILYKVRQHIKLQHFTVAFQENFRNLYFLFFSSFFFSCFSSKVHYDFLCLSSVCWLLSCV